MNMHLHMQRKDDGNKLLSSSIHSNWRDGLRREMKPEKNDTSVLCIGNKEVNHGG